jgi:hypothetical protein
LTSTPDHQDYVEKKKLVYEHKEEPEVKEEDYDYVDQGRNWGWTCQGFRQSPINVNRMQWAPDTADNRASVRIALMEDSPKMKVELNDKQFILIPDGAPDDRIGEIVIHPNYDVDSA